MADVIRHIPDERDITRVALMRGDEELSMALVVPMTIQVGQARLRMDGIGGVATPEEHRNRGYSRRVLEAAVELMTAGDAVLSTLYGIPNFYPKYGYATLGPEYTIAPASLADRDQLPAGWTMRDGVVGDLPALKRLYRDEIECVDAAIVRDDDWWVWNRLATDLEPGAGEVRVVERDGVVAGYAWRTSYCWWMQQIAEDRPPALRVGEAFAADLDAADAVLAMCRRWASEIDLPVVALAIPPSCRVGQAAQLQDTRVTALYGDEREFMGRSIGLRALLQALLPELQARWQAARAIVPRFAVTLVTGDERATLAGDEEGITVDSALPGDVELALDAGTVARLVFGGFAPELTLRRHRVPATMMQMVATLFPKRVPYIYPADRF